MASPGGGLPRRRRRRIQDDIRQGPARVGNSAVGREVVHILRTSSWQAGTESGGMLSDLLWGTKRRQGLAETMAKQTARTVGSQIGRQILRGVLGGILGGGTRRR